MIDLQRVTRAEVAKHNTSNSTWICIDNKVYDVTKFLDEHPGGSEVLLQLAGLDATEQYEDIGHSTYARYMKEQYLVAEIVDEEKVKYSDDNEKLLEQANDTAEKKRYNNPVTMDSTLYVALLVIVFAVIYYTMFC